MSNCIKRKRSNVLNVLNPTPLFAMDGYGHVQLWITGSTWKSGTDVEIQG